MLKDGGILRSAYRGSDPVVMRDAVTLTGLPSVDDIDVLIEGSLLRRPYFTVLREGVTPADSDILASRNVAGTQSSGFIAEAAVRKHLADGATLKLNQVEDWHPFIRGMNDELNSIFPVEAKAFLFYTPAGERGMLPHRDGSHVIAIQLEGEKEWHLYDSPPELAAKAGLDVDTSREQVVMMTPGDVLYLPHGYGHAATATEKASLHLTFTLTEPTPEALVESFISEWIASGRPSAAAGGASAGSPIGRAKALLGDLVDFGSIVDDGALVGSALTAARTRDGSR